MLQTAHTHCTVYKDNEFEWTLNAGWEIKWSNMDIVFAIGDEKHQFINSSFYQILYFDATKKKDFYISI